MEMCYKNSWSQILLFIVSILFSNKEIKWNNLKNYYYTVEIVTTHFKSLLHTRPLENPLKEMSNIYSICFEIELLFPNFDIDT